MRSSVSFQPVSVDGPKWTVSYDSQDIDAVLSISCGNGKLRKKVEDEVDGVTAVAAIVGDGDYDRIAVTGSSRPYLVTTEWTEVLIKYEA